jgi:hypothetical protein
MLNPRKSNIAVDANGKWRLDGDRLIMDEVGGEYI